MKNKLRRPLALLLCAVMIVTMPNSPVYASAESGQPDNNSCEHHTTHTNTCGYTEGMPEIPCTHVCSEESGCITNVEHCNHVQVNEYGTITFLHDKKCGYAEAHDAAPCQFICEECIKETAETNVEKISEAAETLENESETAETLESESEAEETLESESEAKETLESGFEAGETPESMVYKSFQPNKTSSSKDSSYHNDDVAAAKDGILTIEFNSNGFGGAGEDRNEMKTAIDASLQGIDKASVTTIKLTGTVSEITSWNWHYLKQQYISDSGWDNLSVLDLSGMTNLKALGKYSTATLSTKLITLILPDSLKEIDTFTFAGCENLKLNALPEGVTRIGFNAFYNCAGIEHLRIPESVKEIAMNAFENCTNLREVIFDGKTAPVFGTDIFKGITPQPTVFVPLGATGYPENLHPIEISDADGNGYHDGDEAAYRAILEAHPKLKDFSGPDLDLNNPASWKYVTWNEESPKRIRKLAISEKQMAGKLDVSSMTSLENLDCAYNQLTELEVNGLPNLKYLSCNQNQLKSLKVSNLPSLQHLYCNSNQMMVLDISDLPNLTNLTCYNNQLTTLNLSSLLKLRNLYCNHNQLTELDMSGLSNLRDLSCNNNQLISLTDNVGHTLKVSKTGGGTALITNYTFPDRQIILSATPDKRYQFVQWEGLPDGISNDSATIEFTLNDTLDVKPLFQVEPGSKHALTEDMVAPIPEQIYTGQEICPEPAVSAEINGETVVFEKDVDFTCSYADNTNVGTASVIITPTANGQLSGEAVTKTFTVGWLKTTAEGVLSGTEGQNGWYTSDVTVDVPDDYTISTNGLSWSKFLTISNEGTNLTQTYYLKNTDGQIAKKSVTVNIDKTSPVISHTSAEDVTADTARITVTATDNVSGISKYKLSGNGIAEQTNTTGEFSLSGLTPETAYELTVTVTDHAGKASIGKVSFITKKEAGPPALGNVFSENNINYKITRLPNGDIPGEVEIIQSKSASGNLALAEVTYNEERYLITSVAASAFKMCTNLNSVEMPNVTAIGASAFDQCINLSSVEIPNVATIGASAFKMCIKLECVEIPKVTIIEESAFKMCNKLSSVNLSNVTTIGASAFDQCINLSSVDLPKVTNIGAQAFKTCMKLGSVKMPNVKSIGASAFEKTDLTDLTLPSSLEVIGDRAFADCDHFKTLVSERIDAPQLGKDAFLKTDITSFTVPVGATGYDEEKGWPKMQSIIITGIVKDKKDTPVSGASVKAEINEQTYSAVTDENGSYTIRIFASVENQNYTITAKKEGYISGKVSGEITDETVTVNITLSQESVATVTSADGTVTAYTDLDAAAEAAGEETRDTGAVVTLTLLKDVGGRTRTLNLYAGTIFDLGGHTLSGSKDSEQKIVVAARSLGDAEKVEIKNGTVRTEDSESTVVFVSGALSGNATYSGEEVLKNYGSVSGGTFEGKCTIYSGAVVSGGTFTKDILFQRSTKLQGGSFQNATLSASSGISSCLVSGYVGYDKNGNIVFDKNTSDMKVENFTGEVREHTSHTYEYTEDENGTYTWTEKDCPICGADAPEGAGYTVTIPIKTRLGSNTVVSVDNNLSQDKTVTVSTEQKQVTLTRENDAKQTQIVSAVTFAGLFAAQGEKAEGKVTFGTPVYQNDPKSVIPAGTYSGILTFSIGLQ